MQKQSQDRANEVAAILMETLKVYFKEPYTTSKLQAALRRALDEVTLKGLINSMENPKDEPTETTKSPTSIPR